MAAVYKKCATVCFLFLLWSTGVDPFLFEGPIVPCPNPAQNCLQEWFNRVVEGQGCLGCQNGCQDGYMMTSNPKYYIETDVNGHYLYSNVSINNNVNVSEPQWVCVIGDSCQNGFFVSKMGAQDACSWCGLGCASCQSYGNCERCFIGYTIDNHTLPGWDDPIVTCNPTDVPCPSPPTHCMHDSYVTPGTGCVGCQTCEQGYMVTTNPNYMNLSAWSASSTDYMGISIHGGIDINEPRFKCVAGTMCQDGWFPTVLLNSDVCAECSAGCGMCVSRTKCTLCRDGYTLVQNGASDTASCAQDAVQM